MSKNLPNVFAVPINKKMTNNKETYKSSEKESLQVKTITKEEINKIFNDKTHVYKTRVRVTSLNGTEEVDVVGLTKTNLLTLNGKKIDINDILDIKKV